MAYIYSDFVNRDSQLHGLRVAIGQPQSRFVLIEGQKGMGKTFMLKEFHSGIGKIGMKGVYIDLSDTIQGYLDIIYQVPRQIGRHGFEKLIQTMKDLDRKFENSAKSPHEISARLGSIPAQSSVDAGSVGAEGRSGGIDIAQGDLNAPFSQIAGRDLYYVVNVIYMGNKHDRDLIRLDTTNAFLECLSSYDPNARFCLLIDHWESANEETRSWIFDHLVLWALNGQIPGVLLVIACDCKPGWSEERTDISCMKIPRLPNEAVRSYWVNIKELPVEVLEKNNYFFGNPLLMTTYAQVLKKEKIGAVSG